MGNWVKRDLIKILHSLCFSKLLLLQAAAFLLFAFLQHPIPQLFTKKNISDAYQIYCAMTLEKYTLQKYIMIILIMTTTMMIIILITLIRLSWHLLMQGAGCWCQNWNKPDKFPQKKEIPQN